MKNIKISNFISKKGNYIANQFIIETNTTTIFQSYQTIIAKKDKKSGKITLDNDYNYSRTTAKYLRSFLNEGIAETRQKIQTREYCLENLN